MDLGKKGLDERIVQIFATQKGRSATAEGSLIQRLNQVLEDRNQKNLKLSEFRIFNKDKDTDQRVEVTYNQASGWIDPETATFPMVGEEEVQGDLLPGNTTKLTTVPNLIP